MKKAIGYSRYSSVKQGDGSTIQTQHEAIQNYCLENDLLLVEQFSDLALSGKEAEHRTEFLKMIKYAVTYHIDYVVVYTRDRFSRNMKDFIKYLSILADADCELKCVNENINEYSPSGKLSAWIMMSLSEYYLKNLSREALRGLRYNAKHAVWNTTPPYGYIRNRETGKLEINEDEAQMVRLVFDQYLKKQKVTDVQTYLNKHGYKNREGKEFTNSTLYHMLLRRTYIGEYSYNITKGDNPEHIVIPNGVPRIISNKTFFAVEKLIKSKLKKRNYVQEKALLHGKVFCGYTGKFLRERTVKFDEASGHKETYYFPTSNAKSIRTKSIDAKVLDDFCSLFIGKVILSERNQKLLISTLKMMFKNYGEYFVKFNDEIQSKYDKLNKDLSKAILKITDNTRVDVDTIDEISKLQIEVNKLESLICINNQKILKLKENNTEDIEFNIQRLRDAYEVNRKETVNALIDSVILFDETILININADELIPYLPRDEQGSKNIIYADFSRNSLQKLSEDILYKRLNFKSVQLRRRTDDEKTI